MELRNRSSFYYRRKAYFFHPSINSYLLPFALYIQCSPEFSRFRFVFPPSPRPIIRSSHIAFPIYPKAELGAWKKIFRRASIFLRFEEEEEEEDRASSSFAFNREAFSEFRQKNGRREGVDMRATILSREHRGGGDILSARRIPPPFFSCFARKQRAAEREACSEQVVCLPLTSTLLDKDNAPPLIRFGDTRTLVSHRLCARKISRPIVPDT